MNNPAQDGSDAAWTEFARQWAIDGMPKDKQRLANAAYQAGKAARELQQAQVVGETMLPVEIFGTVYNVPIGVQLHIVQLRDKLNAIRNTRRNHPVIELIWATEHCLSAAEEGVDYSVSRPMLDAMTTLGLMEKVGRGKWSPTDAASEFVRIANSFDTTPQSSAPVVGDEMVAKAYRVCEDFIEEHGDGYINDLDDGQWNEMLRAALESALAGRGE